MQLQLISFQSDAVDRFPIRHLFDSQHRIRLSRSRIHQKLAQNQGDYYTVIVVQIIIMRWGNFYKKMKQVKSHKKRKNGPSSSRPAHQDHQPPYQPEPFQPHLYPPPYKTNRYPDVVSHPGKFDDSSDEIIVSPVIRYRKFEKK